MQINLTLESTFKNTAPICNILTNKESVQMICNKKTNKFEIDLAMEKTDKFRIEFINKDGHDDNVVDIKELSIDGINLQHFIYKGEYRPEYNQHWFDRQEIKPPEVYCPGTELRHNGTWHMDISQPIWKMIMEGWLDDDR